jgi:sec-independent protein translocase protein TatB
MGWSELLVIGIVALIVVGPKDLPGMFREFGKFTAKLRGMARDFQRAMEDAADQSGVGDVAKSLRTAANPGAAARSAFKDATKGLSDWDPDAPVDGPSPGKHTAEFTKERQEAAERIRETSALRAEARLKQEAESAATKARVDAKLAAQEQADAATGQPAEPAPDAISAANEKKTT